MKESDELILKSEPIAIKNISVGLSEENILIVFNRDDKADEQDYACTLQAGKLKELISFLYRAGIAYEEEYGKDIGFGTESEV